MCPKPSIPGKMRQYKQHIFKFTLCSSPLCCDFSSPVLFDYRGRFQNSSAYTYSISMKLSGSGTSGPSAIDRKLIVRPQRLRNFVKKKIKLRLGRTNFNDEVSEEILLRTSWAATVFSGTRFGAFRN